MEFILSVAAVLIVFVAMLAINYVVYKREKTLLEINEKYKRFYNRSLDDCVELRELVVSTDNEKGLIGRLSTIALKCSMPPTPIQECLSTKRNTPL